MLTRFFLLIGVVCWLTDTSVPLVAADRAVQRLLYVATPGIRNYLEYGGHGVLVFDIDADHKFVKRIPTAGLDENGKPLNVKGICACAATRRLYVSTIRTLQSFDLTTEKMVWEKAYDKGCDRMAMAPDGKFLYVPSLENDHWVVVDGMSGDVLAKLEPQSGAHNTICGLDGKRAYLAGLKSPLLTVADIQQTIKIGNRIRVSITIRTPRARMPRIKGECRFYNKKQDFSRPSRLA